MPASNLPADLLILTGLEWNSDHVLRVEKWNGKDFALFEFRRIPHGLSGPAPAAAKPAVDENCVMKGAHGPVACIERAGYLSLGELDSKSIYAVPRFAGVAPLTSVELRVGQSDTPPKGPPITVSVKAVSGNTITLDWNEATTGSGSEERISSGSYGDATDYHTRTDYGYFVTLVNPKEGLVKIDILRDPGPDNLADLAVAWQPHGKDLLFVRRSNHGTFLELIEADGGHTGTQATHSRGQKWHLAAEAPISLTDNASSMRFLTPSLLLLGIGDSESPDYREATVAIAHDRSNGAYSLTVGKVTKLPSSLAVSMKDKITHGPVLGWACQTSRD